MTTATISQLGSDYAILIDRVEHGESIAITREGHTVAVLTPAPEPVESDALLTPAPEPSASSSFRKVDWTKSAAANLTNTVPRVSMEDSRAVLHELKGRY